MVGEAFTSDIGLSNCVINARVLFTFDKGIFVIFYHISGYELRTHALLLGRVLDF